MIELKGITWDHSRAYPPLVAAAQRYGEIYPEIRVHWEKRTLHEFGHRPIDQLADHFDLIVIDHPWAAFSFNRGLVRDLKPLLGPDSIADLATHSIGPSYRSYEYDGGLLAAPIDAATPVPSWRADLLARHGRRVPQTIDEVIALADAGLAVMPGFPADLFLNWSMLLEAFGAKPFRSAERIADEGPAFEAMDLLRRLAEGMPEAIFDWNPIAIAERMSRTDDIAYCAFAYSYGNYCREHFCEHPLRYGNLVCLDLNRPLRSVVGGTGLAVTSRCTEAEAAAAADFARYCASTSTQTGLYPYAGGQPARREAWENPALDTFNGGFFSATRDSHENALLRPRYDGYVPLQEEAGVPLQDYLRGRVDRAAAWNTINDRYRKSLPTRDLPAVLES